MPLASCIETVIFDMVMSLLTFAHSGTVVDDKGGNIFIISHLEIVVVVGK